MNLIEEQKEICRKYGSDYYESLPQYKIGIAKNFKNGIWPVNGLRHPSEGDTTGWFIWAGEEFSNDKDFFIPMHIAHLEDEYPSILKYLGLAPGWRFLIAENYEDIWKDDALLMI